MVIAIWHHPLATYWVERIRVHHASYLNLIKLYRTNSRNNKRYELGFCNSLAPDVPNCPLDPS